MIKSKYIYNILDLLLDGDDVGILARKQIEFLTENDIEYTGGGVVISFSKNNEINDVKIENKDLILDGVKIESKELKIEAEARLFFKNGIINFLDIWCYLGDYPKEDLKKYILTQTWIDFGRKIIIE